MGVKRYMISDASRHVNVESHVLRYWEEELGLSISRNELGHRYYTEEDIKLFKNIKLLKEQGFQLKAIKMVIPELATTGESGIEYMLGRREELNEKAELAEDKEKDVALQVPLAEAEQMAAEDKSLVVPIATDKMQQFQVIMSNIIAKALQDNNLLLSKEVGDRVSDNVLKEMDYLMRVREEKDDERFKRLDETIRSVQKNRKLAEKSAIEVKAVKAKKRKKVFGKALV
ncbi:MAG: MerR family transcriptional regulator [Lachnospiraceae bacterium]|nr:MerR family transcriptional regulator [Lachnospiraceae bacterium]